MGQPATGVDPSARDIRQGWAVHLFTALGAAVGMLAIEAVFDGKVRSAMVYLLITQLIDGIDGPIARQIDIVSVIPKIDGYVMDLVIDFVTCVIVPAAFLHRFNMLPSSISLSVACVVVFMSSLWFSRTDMMTDDHWFRGFPCTWNLIVPTLYILEIPRWANAVACIGLCCILLTNVRFPHPVRSSGLRTLTLAVTAAWLGVLALAALRRPTGNRPERIVLVFVIGYFAGLSAWRTRLAGEKVAEISLHP